MAEEAASQTPPQRRSGAKRLLRVVLFSVLGVLVLLVAAAALIPTFYKDEVNQQVQKTLEQYVDADVAYGDVGLSLFRQFPLLSARVEDISVAGRGVFQGDTLLRLGAVDVGVNLWDILFRQKLGLEAIELSDGDILLRVLRDGTANYNILKEQPEQDSLPQPDTAAPAPLNFNLKHYGLYNINLLYNDRSSDLYAQVSNLTHTGSGNFSNEQFSLRTRTDVERLNVVSEGVRYARNLVLKARLDLDVDQQLNRYTFRENELILNELAMAFDGFVEMPNPEDILTELTFEVTRTSFASILSLVPGIYTQDFDQLETRGSLALNGKAKGLYNANSLPSFAVNLRVDNGYFQYPELPAPVQAVNVDLGVNSPTNSLDNLQINLRKFHAEFENNPVDARLLVERLEPLTVDGELNAQLDLGKLTRIFPLDSLDLQGQLALQAAAQGVYHSDTSLPALQANAKLQGGYVKYLAYPTELTNLNIQATAQAPSGALQDFVLNVPLLHGELAGEPFDGALKLANLDNPTYELKLKGALDLAKALELYPLEGVQMAGRVLMDLQTSGSLADVEAERYHKLPASGMLALQNLSYTDGAMPTVAIDSAHLEVTPQALVLTHYQGMAGSSDLQLRGSLRNYVGYLLGDSPLMGQLNLNSNKLNLDEWMAADTSQAPSNQAPQQPAPDEAPEDFTLPANVDFLVEAQAQQVFYDNLILENLRGQARLRNRTLTLENSSFQMLGGVFNADLTFRTPEDDLPQYAFDFGVQSLDINKAAANLMLVERLTPLAAKTAGDMNLRVQLAGKLDEELNPLLNTLNGFGNAKVQQAGIQELAALDRIANITRMQELGAIQARNVSLEFFIQDGRFHVKPFQVRTNKVVLDVAGSNGLDQTIDYTVGVNAPTGQLGDKATDMVSGLVGKQVDLPDSIQLTLGLTGAFTQPEVKLLGSKGAGGSGTGGGGATLKEAAGQAVEGAKQEAKAKAQELQQEAEQKAREELEKRKKEAEEKARQEAEKAKQRAREELEKKRKEAEEKAKEKIKGLFGR